MSKHDLVNAFVNAQHEYALRPTVEGREAVLLAGFDVAALVAKERGFLLTYAGPFALPPAQPVDEQPPAPDDLWATEDDTGGIYPGHPDYAATFDTEDRDPTGGRPLQDRYDDCLNAILRQTQRIAELESEVEQLRAAPPSLQQLRNSLADVESRLESMIDSIETHDGRDLYFEDEDEDDEEPDEWVFLRDIGFDPYYLPSSVGEREELRRKVQEKRDLAALLEAAETDRDAYHKQVKMARKMGFDEDGFFTCPQCKQIVNEYGLPW